MYDFGAKCVTERLTVRKTEITQIFRELRKLGYLARQGFSCCMGCASAELEQLAKDRHHSKGRVFPGTVYYHKQDRDNWLGGGILHLRYSNFEEDLGTGQSMEDVAEQVVELLKIYNIPYNWGGDTNYTIEVAPLAPEDRTKRRGW